MILLNLIVVEDCSNCQKFSTRGGWGAMMAPCLRNLQRNVSLFRESRLVAREHQLGQREFLCAFASLGVRARIIDGSRSKNGNLGLAFGGIRHRIVGSLRKEHL